MPTWTQSNFNGGEWSPLMYGRFTIDKYKTSVAKMLNLVPQIQGGVTRRPGMQFVEEVKDSTQPVRLVRFEFNITQAYVLEFGPYYVRFYANGGQVLNGSVPLEVATNYDPSQLFALNFTQSADVLYITHPAHPPAKLERQAATTWTWTAIDFQDGPYLPLNLEPTTLTIGAFGGSAVTVVASSVVGINNDTGFQSTDVGRSLRVKNAGAWGWGTIATVTDTTHCTINIVSAMGGTTAGANAPVMSGTGGSVLSIPLGTGGSGYAVAPAVSISSPSSGGSIAQAQTIIDKGVVTAILVTYPGTNYGGPPGVYIAAPPSVPAPFATNNWRLGVWSTTTGFPAVATFYEDRLFFAGCTNYPTRLDGSNSSDYENMAPTDVDATVLATHAVSFSLNAADVNVITWMLSDEKGLQVGTASAEWLVRADSTGQALTPTNIQAKPSTYYGSAPVAPVKAGRRALFIQRGGKKMRESSYEIQIDGFAANDISLVSEHLFSSPIVQMGLQRIPQQVVWLCRSDGVLIGLTYEYEEQVVGFHEHDVDGIVESLCCIPHQDGSRDDVWLLVRRLINGVQRRYIEVMTKFWQSGDSVAATSYLDSSAEYVGSPATTITGLGYLEGETVSVLADGATHPDCVVTGGSITLNRPSSTVWVGLAMTSDLLTHRMEVQTTEGVGQMKYGKITEGALRVTDTLGGMIGPNFDTMEIILDRSSADAMDSAPALRQGDIVRLFVEDSYETYNQIAIRQDQPLPLNLQMISAQCEKAA